MIPEFPVQVSKVQAPPLRDETLARYRLLDWLSVKIHRRVVLLTAEAGYGKTTLLADFTRRTRLRVLWFRLDRGDRDWTGFIAHLVAAVRVHLPEFGPLTRSLLAETATTAPPLETVLETFLRELVALPPEPSALVFDDFHLVDDAADIRHIVRELLTRGPERLTFVFASRREPPIRLARLRALGEVAELGTDDLRFDAAETERLFRDTYEMRLEPSMLAELSRRTEGWAASLQLVRAALHDRDPGQVRSFISSLSGAEGHLYEYLAEEVIGELPDDLQQFLMRTSVLETIDLTLGPVAADVTVDEAKRLIEEGERHGLLGRGGFRSRHKVRAHPLVRDFLYSRLAAVVGGEGRRAIHMRVARAAVTGDWQVAAQQFVAAGSADDASSVLGGAIEKIVGSGALATAEEIATSLPAGLPGAAGLVLLSRIAQQRAARNEGLALAEAAWAAEPKSSIGLLNLVSARSLAGDVAGAVAAGRLLETSGTSSIAEMGRVFREILEASVSGSVPLAISDIDGLIRRRRGSAELHFLGIGLLNRAYLCIAAAQPELALDSADEAIAMLTLTSQAVDLISARTVRAYALAYLGRIDEARTEIRKAAEEAAPGQYLEIALEAAQIEGHFGESTLAWPYLERAAAEITPGTDLGEQAIYGRALLHIREGRFEQALRDTNQLTFGRLGTSISLDAQRHFAKGLAQLLLGSKEAVASIARGTRLARLQSATLWENYGGLLRAAADASSSPSAEIVRAESFHPAALSMLADAVVLRLDDVDAEAFGAIAREADRRPWRWRTPARRIVQSKGRPGRERAADLLEVVGDASDVALLRQVSRASRSGAGQRRGVGLARRLAAKVFVEDLGRLLVYVGPRLLDGSGIRRKVLALLCLLLSKPRFSSTREEVIDSLWPEHDPQSALNSLNQTAYFLRRVFEPDYQEASSPGYVGQDVETIWLEPELIDCRSRRCLEIIRTMPAEPTPEGSVALATEYQGRYALDFAYEDWSGPYRDYLHASYLRVMEQAVRLDLDAGHLLRGTFLAERAFAVDPDAEEIQVALISLYRLSGAHAAAAETYSRYERAMREIGVEPIPLADL